MAYLERSKVRGVRIDSCRSGRALKRLEWSSVVFSSNVGVSAMQIAIIAVGSRGDVQPNVALRKGLRDAGHSVRVVTHASFSDLVRDEGLDFADLGGDARALVESHFDWKRTAPGETGGNSVLPRQHSWLPRGVSEARDAMRSGRGMMDALMAQMEEMTEKCWRGSQDVDVLVASTLGTLMGIPVSRRRGIPSIVAYAQPLTPTKEFHPTFVIPPAPRWLAPLRPYYNLLAWKIFDRGYWQMFEKPIRKAEQVLHTPVQASLTQIPPPGVPILYGYSPSFLPQPKDWPAHCHVTGYWFLDTGSDWQPPAGLLDFLRTGAPPVYIGFGSMIDRDPKEITRIAVKALESAGQRGILLTGWGALSKAAVPDQVFLLDSVPHDWLFPRVSAVVHHGGAGTTGAGLRAGKPTIIVPFTADQAFWGQQVYTRGVGPKPIAHTHLSAETLAEAITTAVTNSGIRAKAEVLGEKVRAEDGVGKAVEVLSRYVQR